MPGVGRVSLGHFVGGADQQRAESFSEGSLGGGEASYRRKAWLKWDPSSQLHRSLPLLCKPVQRLLGACPCSHICKAHTGGGGGRNSARWDSRPSGGQTHRTARCSSPPTQISGPQRRQGPCLLAGLGASQKDAERVGPSPYCSRRPCQQLPGPELNCSPDPAGCSARAGSPRGTAGRTSAPGSTPGLHPARRRGICPSKVSSP